SMRAVASKVDQSLRDLFFRAEFNQTRSKSLSASNTDGSQIRRAVGVDDDFALRDPEVLALSSPVFLQLAAPPFAMLGNAAGVVRGVKVPNHEICARRLPLTTCRVQSRTSGLGRQLA